jgi:hypothetical protein
MGARKLASGQTVTIHRNDGLRKRCACSRRKWAECSHPWHFSFKWKDEHHRFPIDRYAEGPINSRDDARDEAERLRRLIRAGNFPPAPTASATPSTPADLTFEAFGEKWVTNARSQHSDNQQMNDRGIIRRLSKIELEPGVLLGQRPIGLFTVDDWEAAFAKTGPCAGSTYNKIRQCVLALQDWGCDKGYLPKPWLTGKVIRKSGSIARRKGARRDRRLTADVLDERGKVKTPGEERRLIEHASPWLQRVIICALESGMRRGEILSLRWQDVSLSRTVITLRAESTKTRTMRQIPISPRLLAVLKLLQLDPDGKELPLTWHVFGNAIGGKVAGFKKVWAKALKGAGIEDLHFHDLRHEAGSRWLEAGWPLSHVQRALGHQSAATTSIYLNAGIEELRDSMKRFGTGGHPLHDLAQTSQTEPPPAVQRLQGPAANVTVN